jgi:hypothetical protein
MSIQELQLKHALNEAKSQILHLEEKLGHKQPKDMKPSSLDAIALLDTEIYNLDDRKIEMEHSYLLTVTENS